MLRSLFVAYERAISGHFLQTDLHCFSMIRMIQSKSSGHAKAYFSDALSKSDYYVSNQEMAGYWQGRLARRLGLEGSTSKEAFFALCENRHPESSKSLTPRTREDRTTGYDINF